MFVGFSAAEEVLKALAEVGRTEDIQFSPDGRRLAVAGLQENRVLILEIERMVAEPAWDIRFSRATTLKSASFEKPHGLAWIDNEVLLVANREGCIPIVRAPLLANSSELLVHPIQVLGASEADYVSTPGSVSLRRLGQDIIEVLICNNFVHTVSRHFLSSEGFSILASETVVDQGLSVPDGVAYSRSGGWIAVSNHYDHSVFLYRADQLGHSSSPAGTLRGIGYPHGLSFTPDDRALFVADAGAPYVHLFVAKEGDWGGTRIPVSSIKIMDDETFARGHYNPEEGGPKGLTVSPDGNLICLTHEEQPLVFFDVRDELARAGVAPRDRAAPEEIGAQALTRMLAGTMERTRSQLASALRREKDLMAGVEAAGARAGAERRAQDLEQQMQVLQQRLRAARLREKAASERVNRLMRSSSWRLTSPLRAAKGLLFPKRP